MSYPIRKIARIYLKAESAFAINSGKIGLIHDNEILRDANGLPFIPGTSLAGVIRHLLGGTDETSDVFGSGGKNGEGSRVMISSAHLVGEEGKVLEGLQALPESNFYSYFQRLPFRDHVAINEKGAAVKGAKFDDEIIFKGTRFVFDIEMICESSKEPVWDKLLSVLFHPDFRIGHGTRKGMGKLKLLEESRQVSYDLTSNEGLDNYLKKSASLNGDLPGEQNPVISDGIAHEEYFLEKIELVPEDFFLFGAGYGDSDVDRTSKRENIVSWTDGKPQVSEQQYILIPATSIKGALAHRVIFHYNSEIGNHIQSTIQANEKSASVDLDSILTQLEKLVEIEKLSLETSDEDFNARLNTVTNFEFSETDEWVRFEKELANDLESAKRKDKTEDISTKIIRDLFGYASDQEQAKGQGQRGNVVIEDIYIPYHPDKEKIFNHVKIDRFTGGASNSALFQEKAYYHPAGISIEISIKKTVLDIDPHYSIAWNKAVDDLKSGLIPLGGMTTKGHGLFKPSTSPKS
jgi:CRISPR/Cas system CSM-associated protein Csm3 (group 7 of RAMP superfamily)